MTDYYTPQILVLGRYSYQDIDLTVGKESNREIITNIQDDIHKTWEAKVAELKAMNLPAWNGTTYRVEDIGFDEKRISLTLSPTLKYSELFTEGLFTDYYRKSHRRYLNHLSIAAIVETSDGKFIMGETAYPHRVKYDTIGGGVQESELPIHTHEDLRQTLHKELTEEIGVMPKHIIDEYICGIVVGSKTNIIIISRIKLNLASDAMPELFLSRTDKDELKGVGIFSRDEYITYCNSSTTYRPFLSQLVEV